MGAVRSQILALGLLTLAVLGIERLIVTDREAIQDAATGAARALAERRWDALADLLHEEFRHGPRDRAATLAWVRGLVENHAPRGIEVQFSEIDLREEGATASGAVAATVLGRRYVQDVTAEWVREAGRWRLLGLQSGGLR